MPAGRADVGSCAHHLCFRRDEPYSGRPPLRIIVPLKRSRKPASPVSGDGRGSRRSRRPILSCSIAVSKGSVRVRSESSKTKCSKLTPRGLTLRFVYLRLLHTHRHYPPQVLTIFLGVEPTGEGVEFGVGHVPPEFDLLLVHRREKLGVRAAHDRIDTL